MYPFKEGGIQNYTLEDLTKGFHQLANLCSMRWTGYIATGNFVFFLRDKPEELKKMKDIENNISTIENEIINFESNFHKIKTKYIDL